MEIILAKTAGFCFGVDRAVRMTEQLAAGGHKVATLGPLIHNPQCVAALEAQGVEIMTCGTCLNFYGLTEKLAVGSVTNMYTIVEKLTQAGNVVKP